MTFDPHPLSVVAPERAPKTLTPRDEKLRWFEQAGVDVAVIAQSTPDLLSLTAEAFVEQVVVGRFQPRWMVEGSSFGFGRGRKGDVGLLRQLGTRHGFDVHVVEPVRLTVENDEQVLVSSSMIRDLVRRGLVRRAALCLGHPYALISQVVHGAQRGRGLGFPTANLRLVDDQLVPAAAVYAGRACVTEKTYAAAVSIGTNATFGGTTMSVEAHLLDYDGDLYDQTIRVEFLDRVRDQRKFESADALREQLVNDIDTVRSING
jgi:riboflavin kinase/FMN adenylyltransferase